MIALEVFDDMRQHGRFSTSEPAHFDFYVDHGRLVIEAYSQDNDEPVGCYDGWNHPESPNVSWMYDGDSEPIDHTTILPA